MTNKVIPQDMLLVKILKLTIKLCGNIETPKHLGRPFFYKPLVIICCLIIMVAKHLTVRGLHAFLVGIDDLSPVIRQTIPFPESSIPDRRTFDRRFKKSIMYLQLSMISITLFLVKRFSLGIARLSLDNRMFEAMGNIWHRKDQKKGIIPKGLRNIDKTAGWGVSFHRGWVFGHALDVFVTTGKYVLPIFANARSLVKRGNTSIKELVSKLPKAHKGIVAADSEYLDNLLAEKLATTGRNLHTPSKYYPKNRPKSKTYLRRKVTSEPFFERFLQAFIMRGKLDRKGPDAWPYLVGCCLLYQLMVTYNLLQGRANPLEVTHLIRIL